MQVKSNFFLHTIIYFYGAIYHLIRFCKPYMVIFQDEISDVKYHLNELKHSVSFNNFGDDAYHGSDNDSSNADDSADDSDSDLNQSHDLTHYMIREQPINSEEPVCLANEEADVDEQMDENAADNQTESMQQTDQSELSSKQKPATEVRSLL